MSWLIHTVLGQLHCVLQSFHPCVTHAPLRRQGSLVLIRKIVVGWQTVHADRDRLAVKQACNPPEDARAATGAKFM
jgi:hypothetical protein